MNKLALIFAAVSSCVPKPPSVPVEETEYLDDWTEVVIAWEADATLPPVPDTCDGIEIAIIERADVGRYDGPGSNTSSGYLTGNIAVALSDSADIRTTLMHEMTHWLAMCTGLYVEGRGVADRLHADPRLWSPGGVVDRAVRSEGVP